ncbi:MAG: 2-C-methyl-D-erythritol 4-phosphate cytidylyltransferase [Planctomycetota bacterium]|nr:MAG: 2-C-methyl-D-erythritol 4-phosphate cytidylyltransferase [Planctomycetota bacterium]
MSKVAIIIPAAGAGKRFGGNVKKPFALIDDRPIFIRSVELFISRDDVCQTILAVAPDDYDVVREKYAANLMFMDIKLVKGGKQRYESVKAALQAVDADAELVAVHDAVRPCVLSKWIDAVFDKARETGAAILAAPLTGTIKRVRDGVVTETVSRAGLYEAQTPQVFRKQLLIDAYAALPADAEPTDDAGVVEAFGHSVAIVEADRRNLKITTPGDMALAGPILKDIARQQRPDKPLSPFEEAQW